MKQDIAVSETGGISLAVAIEPFQGRPSCPKCGNRAPNAIAELSNSLQGKGLMLAVRLAYCPGSVVKSPSCSVVEDEHLHAMCAGCGYTWLMECQAAS